MTTGENGDPPDKHPLPWVFHEPDTVVDAQGEIIGFFMAGVGPRVVAAVNENDIDHMPFTPSPEMDWIRSHPAEMAPYVGQFVVIDAQRGILAHGDDAVELARRFCSETERPMVTWCNQMDAQVSHLSVAPVGTCTVTSNSDNAYANGWKAARKACEEIVHRRAKIEARARDASSRSGSAKHNEAAHALYDARAEILAMKGPDDGEV